MFGPNGILILGPLRQAEDLAYDQLGINLLQVGFSAYSLV